MSNSVQIVNILGPRTYICSNVVYVTVLLLEARLCLSLAKNIEQELTRSQIGAKKYKDFLILYLVMWCILRCAC